MKTERFSIALPALNLALLVFVLARGVAAVAEPVDPVLRARAFELVGPDGGLRARLNVESDGEVVFRLLDEKGTIRVKLGADEHGSGLVLLDDSTQVGLHILAKGTGSSLRLADKNGQERLITPSAPDRTRVESSFPNGWPLTGAGDHWNAEAARQDKR